MAVLEFSRQVRAPRDSAWAVISDVVGYADVAPNLSAAAIVEGAGEGMIRRCWDTNGGTWVEQCTRWEEGRRYEMTVDTSDYPYPFRKMQGSWAVEDEGDGSRIVMRFDYEMKYGMIGRLLGRLVLGRKFGVICERILDNWEQMLSERQVTVGRSEVTDE